MKIDIIDEKSFVVYCINQKKRYYLNNTKELKKNINYIFKYIKNHYEIEVDGMYKVTINQDKYNNYIIEIEEDYEDELLYTDNRLDIEVFSNDNIDIMYKTNNYFYIHKFRYNHDIYFYENNYYLLLKRNISKKNYSYLLEMSDIIYKNTKKIQKDGIKVIKKMVK